MAERPTFVIVGGGLAAGMAVGTLREEGFDGAVVVVGDENELPYERPPLSKGYLRGEDERESTRVHARAFYRDNEVELRLGRTVTALDVSGGKATLDDGSTVAFHRALLAPGATPKALDVPGADLDGVHLLRSLADADALRAAISPGTRVVAVGGSWIACEAAASARQLGAEVALVLRGAEPLERILGSEIGAIYAGVHRDNGVEVVPRSHVEAIEGSGSVEAVRLRDGRRLECGLVVAGVGVVPRTDLAAAAGLAIDDGIVVDDRLATSAPTVFCAGDAANAPNGAVGRRLRVEHWENARVQGALAARAMLGLAGRNDALPYFFSDQFDAGMEYSGAPERWDRVVIRGSVESRELIAFWVLDGRVVAGMNLNVWDVQEPIRALIASGRQVDADGLADPDTPLEDL